MLIILEGEIRYDTEADLNDRQQLLERIRDILDRGYRAHCDALSMASNYADVLGVLSGEGVRKPGFRPDNESYQDYCYAGLSGITVQTLRGLKTEELQQVLYALVEREK